MTTQKYDALAETWTEANYPHPARYFDRKAELVVSLGPRLAAGDSVLELACADAALAEPLIARGLRYAGADLSAGMVDAAARRLGGRGRVEHGDMSEYRPPEPVAATVFFRSLYYPADRPAFFRHVASFTEKKLVFDFSPRRFAVDELRRELAEAGFGRLRLRPFFVPTTHPLPSPALAALALAERITPLARALLRVRFTYVAAASREP